MNKFYATLLAFSLCVSQMLASDITWAVTNGAWDTTTANWSGDATTFTDDETVNVTFTNSAGGTITISPNMSPLSTTVSASSGTYRFNGGPIAYGSLTKTGAGTLYLFDDMNTMTGAVNLIEGTLKLDTSGTQHLGTGAFTISGGTFEIGGNNVAFCKNSVYNINSDFNMIRDASGQQLDFDIGDVVLGVNAVINSTNMSLRIVTQISGAYGLTLTGNGGEIRFLGTNNIYTGKTIVEGGTLRVQKLRNEGVASSLGMPTGANAVIDLHAGTTLNLLRPSDDQHITDRPINLAGNSSGTVTIKNFNKDTDLTLNSDFTATGTGVRTLLLTMFDDRPEMYINGVIPDMSDASPVSLETSVTGNSPHWVILSGANTHSGNTTILFGKLRLNNVLALQNSTLQINDGATPELIFMASITNFTFGGLSGTNDIPLIDTDTDGVNLSVGNNNEDTTFNGTLSGSGSLTKIGTGTLTLASSNTLSGSITISTGTLVFESTSVLENQLIDQQLEGTGDITFKRDGSNATNLMTTIGNALSTFTGNISFEGGANGLGYGIFDLVTADALGVADTITIDPESRMILSVADVVPDTADIYVTVSGQVTSHSSFDLSAGYTEAVSKLFIDGSQQDSGTYGSTASGADYQNDDIFTGTGMINVVSGYKALVIGGKTIVIGGKTLKGFNY